MKPKTTYKRVGTTKAFALIGKNSGALYLDESLTKYEIYYDGFIAERKLTEYIGRGQMVEMKECSITYALPKALKVTKKKR